MECYTLQKVMGFAGMIFLAGCLGAAPSQTVRPEASIGYGYSLLALPGTHRPYSEFGGNSFMASLRLVQRRVWIELSADYFPRPVRDWPCASLAYGLHLHLGWRLLEKPHFRIHAKLGSGLETLHTEWDFISWTKSSYLSLNLGADLEYEPLKNLAFRLESLVHFSYDGEGQIPTWLTLRVGPSFRF